jgi:RNA polymerase-binding transcription factor
MKEADVTEFKASLMRTRDEILGKSRQREDIWIVPSNEQIETVQLAGEREFAVRTLERESKTLIQVGIALQRIKDGEFGICIECEEPISIKRLTAVPWAACCLHCQELLDDRETPETLGVHLAA